eukprot:1969392-Rhodomonas_salina.2
MLSRKCLSQSSPFSQRCSSCVSAFDERKSSDSDDWSASEICRNTAMSFPPRRLLPLLAQYGLVQTHWTAATDR